LREGKSMTLKVTLGRREDAEKAVQTSAEEPEKAPALVTRDVLGLTLSALTDELREQLGLGAEQEGLVVTDVDDTAEAYEKGLRAGDLITEAGQEKITSIEDLDTRLAEVKDAGRKSLLLLIRRDGDPRFVALSLAE
jgi:serine protease Do